MFSGNSQPEGFWTELCRLPGSRQPKGLWLEQQLLLGETEAEEFKAEDSTDVTNDYVREEIVILFYLSNLKSY